MKIFMPLMQHMLAIVEVPEKQIEWNLKAMEIAEKSNNDHAKG